MLSNLRPCCESSLDESSGLCEEPKGKVPIDFGNGNIRRKKCKGYKKHRQWNCDYKEVKDACPISCKICTPWIEKNIYQMSSYVSDQSLNDRQRYFYIYYL